MPRPSAGLLFVLVSLAAPLEAADWPTWRYDAGRTANSPEALAPELHLQWSRDLATPQPAWPEDNRLGFDTVYEPIVVGDTLYLASMTSDSIAAFDTATGKEKWRFYAGGPVRLAPVAHEGRLYFGADDATFYCLDAQTGRTVWKFNVAPTERKVIGNTRLISVWPVRGGPVIADGVVYFAAGVWPFEGAFLYAVDIKTGQPVAGSAVDGSETHPDYTSLVLTDLSPQGYLANAGRRIFIPCGRSKVACLDLDSGQLVNLNYDSKGFTDYHAVVDDDWLFHGDTIYDAKENRVLDGRARRPIVADDAIYTFEPGAVIALDRANPQYDEKKDRRGRAYRTMKLPEKWRLPSDQIVDVPAATPDGVATPEDWIKAHPLELFVRAGERLYGHQAGKLFAVDPPEGDQPARVSWSTTLDGAPGTMAAAGGRLFVVTREGKLLCYGAEPVAGGARVFAAAAPSAEADDDWQERAAALVDQAGTAEGYCFALGIGSGRLIEELARQTKLHVVAFDPDAKKVEALRRRLDAQGLYGARAVVEVGDPLHRGLPPYFASLVVCEDPHAAGLLDAPDLAEAVFHPLRPYGGAAWLPLSTSEHERLAAAVDAATLPAAELARQGEYSVLRRAGALPGSADWTHEYGDASNTLMSTEELVRAPLGVLWFGGPSAMGDIYYDRHEWGPSMAVIDGRIFINGDGRLTCVDVYTGRVLWQNELPRGTSVGRAGNFTSNGYHFCVTHDALYIVYDNACHFLDPATGKEKGVFKLPDEEDQWGRFRILDDKLIVEVFRKVRIGVKWPAKLVAVDRTSGKTLWQREATNSYPFFALGPDRVYSVDTLLEQLYHDMRRKGLVPKAASERSLVAIDADSGDIVWQQKTEFVPTWLSYSSDLDVLVASSKSGMIAHRGETGEPLWQKTVEGEGFAGHPESVWDKVILWKDRIIDQRGPGKSYYLETGEPLMERNAITGEPVEWEFTKEGHHCNYAIASPYLMTFRAADAGYYDMATGGTSRLRGFRSGCRNSLIPADGVLNAPNFAHGCVCGYSLFTSLSFVHVPEAEMWTYSPLDAGQGEVRRVGINLGAPGDRSDDNGTLWLDYPSVGGRSPDVKVRVEADQPRYFRLHATQIEGDGATWVGASGLEGVKSVVIPLNRQATTPRDYTVRLYFTEPQAAPELPRTFDVALGGKPVLEAFDVVAEAGGPRRMVVREFKGIEAVDEIAVGFTPRSGRTVVCGVEVVAEN